MLDYLVFTSANCKVQPYKEKIRIKNKYARLFTVV